LLALAAGQFDTVSLDKMRDAERAVRDVSKAVPAEVQQRFATVDKLADTDRDIILGVVAKALAPFQAKP
jgi:hypothetical protein